MHKLPCFWPEDWVKSPLNYSIVDNHTNLILLDYVQEGVYEVHIYFEDRGAEALTRANAIKDWIFHQTPARLLIGKTPVLEKGAWLFARLVGFKRVGVIDTKWGSQFMSSLSKEQWNESRNKAT